MEERGSTLFLFTVNETFIYLKEFTPRSDCVKFAKFELPAEEETDDVSNEQLPQLRQKFPQMKLLHSQFYNDKAMSMLFAYKKDRPTANCFVQFPIQPLLSRLTGARIQRRITIDPDLQTMNLRQLLDPELIRPLDICDGSSLAVSGGRKIATIISATRKKFYHFEMEVDEADFDDDENEGSDNEQGDNDAMNNTNE